MLEVSIAPDQMAGIYNYAEYKALVADLGKLDDDVRRARMYIKRMQDPSVLATNDPRMVAYQDALDSGVGSVATILSEEIDTRKPGLWLHLRDALISATRLLMYPELTNASRVSVYDLVVSVGMLLDAAGCLADGVPCSKAFSIAENDMKRRAAAYIVDIICGRTAAWLAYIDDMGAQAAAMAGGNWLHMRDAYAAQCQQRMVDMLVHATGSDYEAAKSTYIETMIEIAEQYQQHQWKVMRENTGQYCRELTPDEMRACLRAARIADVGSALVMPAMDAADLRGYCYTFAVSPVACTFNITMAFEKGVRGVMETRHAAQVLERMAR